MSKLFRAELTYQQDMLPTSYIQDNESTNEMLLRSAEYQLFILQPSGMCLACSNIKLGNQYPSTHHTVSRLKDSANRGCPTCRFMMKYFLGGSEGRSAEVSIDLKQSVIRYRVPNSGGGSQAVFELFAKTGWRIRYHISTRPELITRQAIPRRRRPISETSSRIHCQVQLLNLLEIGSATAIRTIRPVRRTQNFIYQLVSSMSVALSHAFGKWT